MFMVEYKDLFKDMAMLKNSVDYKVFLNGTHSEFHYFT